MLLLKMIVSKVTVNRIFSKYSSGLHIKQFIICKKKKCDTVLLFINSEKALNKVNFEKNQAINIIRSNKATG